MDTLHRRIAKNIRARAKERGIMITHLADRAGVGRTTVFVFLAGKSSPTVGWLAKVATALDCDAVDLLAKVPKK